VAGLLAGMVIERKRRLVALRYENEKRASVLRAVRQLVMVLSHYFLNAALVTEADVKRLKKDGGIDARNEALDEIEAQARKTESVIGLLRDIDFEKLLDGSDPGYKKMLEVNSEIEKRLGVTDK
jgi:aromatic ring-opening dioxygenase LigB subunit